MELSKEIMPVFHILLTLSRLSLLLGASAILTRSGSKKNALANKKSQLAFNGLACSLLLKDFMPVKLPDEPGDITAYQLLAPIRQKIEAIVITVLFLNYCPGMLVAISLNCCAIQATVQ